jgi:hypothetical protein
MSGTIASETVAWNLVQEENQYSLAKILGIWVAAALPMGILSWVVYPALVPDFEADLLGAGFTWVSLMAVGLMWVFVLALIIVYREEGDLRWATIRRRLWLNTPRDPKTGEARRKLWLWLFPIIILLIVVSMMIGPFLDRLWTTILLLSRHHPAMTPAKSWGLQKYRHNWWAPGISCCCFSLWPFLIFLAKSSFSVACCCPRWAAHLVNGTG